MGEAPITGADPTSTLGDGPEAEGAAHVERSSRGGGGDGASTGGTVEDDEQRRGQRR